MSITDNTYNTFQNLPYLQYQIISYLVDNNQTIWKVLKYPIVDCLNQPDLTLDDKRSLIYGGQENSSGFRMFMDTFQDDSFVDQCSIIRICPPNLIIPTNRNVADVVLRIEILSHTKIQYIDGGDKGYINRNVYLLQQLLQNLNGIDKIPGIARLVFDQNDNKNDKAILNLSNNRNYSGFSLLMSTFTK